MTPSFFTTRTGSLCACCLVMFLFGSRTCRIRQAQNSKSRSLGGSQKPITPGPGLGRGGGPRVYVRDGFVVTLWTYYEPVSPRDVTPAEYAQALERLHAGMRGIDFTAPHFPDRVPGGPRRGGHRGPPP